MITVKCSLCGRYTLSYVWVRWGCATPLCDAITPAGRAAVTAPATRDLRRP